jgi:hypothetical protein
MSDISNSQTLTILIEWQPDGEYAAIDGKTKRAAIDDLIEQMDERDLIDERR